jgi:hypothetical protein
MQQRTEFKRKLEDFRRAQNDTDYEIDDRFHKKMSLTQTQSQDFCVKKYEVAPKESLEQASEVNGDSMFKAYKDSFYDNDPTNDVDDEGTYTLSFH